MKNITLIIFLVATMLSAKAQDITGDWFGKISVMGSELRLNFHISEKDGAYFSTMDSPDQGAFGIPAESTVYKDGILTILIGNIKCTLSLNDEGNLVGEFKQAVVKTDLTLIRKAIEAPVKAEVVRPQTPKAPFTYKTEDIVFTGGGDYQLAGTLSLPDKMKKNTPVVVLVSGSGPQDRDDNIVEHKPFFVIAGAFARSGSATLRYDDRGTGKATGSFINGTTEDNIKDAQAAIAFLKSRGYKNIGAAGHSEGGMIVAELSAQNPDLSFIISLAGTGVSGAEVLKKQVVDVNTAVNAPQEIMSLNAYTAEIIDVIVKENITSADKAKEVIAKICTSIPDELITSTGMSREDYISLSNAQVTDKWTLYFLTYNPAEAWKNVKCPVLALNGKKDLQVNYEINLEAIEKAVGNNVKFEKKAYDDLNHLFQHCTTGSPTEYESIEETFSEEVINDMIKFIKGL